MNLDRAVEQVSHIGDDRQFRSAVRPVLCALQDRIADLVSAFTSPRGASPAQSAELLKVVRSASMLLLRATRSGERRVRERLTHTAHAPQPDDSGFLQLCLASLLKRGAHGGAWFGQ